VEERGAAASGDESDGSRRGAGSDEGEEELEAEAEAEARAITCSRLAVEEGALSQDATKSFNRRGVQQGDVVVHRAPILRCLRVPASSMLHKPFRPPMPAGWTMPAAEAGLGAASAASAAAGVVRKRLGMTRKVMSVLPGAGRFRVPELPAAEVAGARAEFDEERDALSDKYAEDPVVLYEAASAELDAVDAAAGGEGEEDEASAARAAARAASAAAGHRVVVEPIVGKFLREHQREGIAFLFECVAGLRKFGGQGCILADDMGLGKTLQSITLIYTVLRQGLVPGQPLARRVVVVTPTSLVRNWDNEVDKWLKGRVRCLALAESSRAEVEKQIKLFVSTRTYEVMVISYDTFRLNAALLEGEGACDLLICDEAHRLKNDATQTSQALDRLKTRRRVLLSGTPMQNDLEEFFAMVNFCNPSVLGSVSEFRKRFQNPILVGREPDASEAEQALGEARSGELSDLVNEFILRRTNSLLSKHLPPKLTQVVCIKLSELQTAMYQHMVVAKLAYHDEEKEATAAAMAVGAKRADKAGQPGGISAQSLASINALKKLCNHPQLLFQRDSKYAAKGARGSGAGAAAGGATGHAFGIDTINQFFPDGFDDAAQGSRRSRGFAMGSSSSGGGGTSSAGGAPAWSSARCNADMSGKFLVVERLLELMRAETDDRMVIVSNYTQTLDLFQLMMKERGWPFVRLDGSASAKKRQQMVDRLNDPADNVFVFLLSSKAGGCGLNLIGANRLILFDPDWNPATDKQAAARVWRDGQKKRTYVYRFLATGTIEEKVFQRQLSKEGLQEVLADAGEQSLESTISTSDLRDLFTLCDDTVSDTHDKYKCQACCFQGRELPALGDLVLGPERVLNPLGGAAVPAGASSPRRAGLSPPPAVRAGGRPGRLGAAGAAPARARPVFFNQPATVRPDAPQQGYPGEGDLLEWSHHFGCESVDDVLLRKAGRGLVTFVFGQAIDGDALAKKAELDAAKAAAKGDAAQPQPTKIPRLEPTTAPRQHTPGLSSSHTPAPSRQPTGKAPGMAPAPADMSETDKVVVQVDEVDDSQPRRDGDEQDQHNTSSSEQDDESSDASSGDDSDSAPENKGRSCLNVKPMRAPGLTKPKGVGRAPATARGALGAGAR
jgi:SNF2 family DNA or RNA helicase